MSSSYYVPPELLLACNAGTPLQCQRQMGALACTHAHCAVTNAAEAEVVIAAAD